MVKDTTPCPPPEHVRSFEEIESDWAETMAKQIDCDVGDTVRERSPRGGQVRDGVIVEMRRPRDYAGQKECYTYAMIQIEGFERPVMCWTGALDLVQKAAA